jgi:hypothetical protein
MKKAIMFISSIILLGLSYGAIEYKYAPAIFLLLISTLCYALYLFFRAIYLCGKRGEFKKLLRNIEKDIIEGHGISREHERQLTQYINEYSDERARESRRDQSIREKYN